jgi:hypothetical protein
VVEVPQTLTGRDFARVSDFSTDELVGPQTAIWDEAENRPAHPPMALVIR